MAQILKNSHHSTKPKTSCFFSCFGFSGKVQLSGKSSLQAARSKSKKKTRWFSWMRFRMKNSGIKTVPVDSTEKTESVHKVQAPSKLKWKSGKASSKSQSSIANHKPPRHIPEVTSDQETRQGSAQNIILERKKLDHVGSPTDDTCSKRRLSFCKKLEAIRTGCSSQPGSPDINPKHEPAPTAVLSHSTSLPAPPREKRVAQNQSSHSRVKLKKPRKDNIASTRKLDPIVGMSIIIVTLMIMLYWGRLYAILCTSAWFYFVPQLRISSEDINSGSGDPDPNYEEYKKKVVLEGFLERNRRGTTTL